VNYLGHLVLSGDNDEVLFGNFIADVVKGNSYSNWSANIQKGILLHRLIDDFTDNNYHYLLGKRRFYESYPKMGGVILDIVYDHLLWQNETVKASLNLEKEIIRYYQILDNFKDIMPPKIRFMYGYMKRDDWLTNYQSEDGIKRALKGIGRRIGYSNNLDGSFEIVKNNKNSYMEEFNEFFHAIQKEVDY